MAAEASASAQSASDSATVASTCCRRWSALTLRAAAWAWASDRACSQESLALSDAAPASCLAVVRARSASAWALSIRSLSCWWVSVAAALTEALTPCTRCSRSSIRALKSMVRSFRERGAGRRPARVGEVLGVPTFVGRSGVRALGARGRRRGLGRLLDGLVQATEPDPERDVHHAREQRVEAEHVDQGQGAVAGGDEQVGAEGDGH